LINAVASLVGASQASSAQERVVPQTEAAADEPSTERVVKRRWSRIARHDDRRNRLVARQARDAGDSRAQAIPEEADTIDTVASSIAVTAPRPSTAAAEPQQGSPADSNSREGLFREFLRFQDRWNSLFR